jgi:hypothetical protein
MQAQPELMRQHQAYKAVRERLFAPRPVRNVAVAKPEPQILVLRDCDEHVKAWRRWKRFSEALAKSVSVRTFSTEGHFEASLAPSPYEVTFSVGEGPWVPTLKRSIPEICLGVLQDFPGVTLSEVRGASRNRTIVAARMECMYALREERSDLSLPVIGKFFGNRDHTTVIHALNKIKAQREKESA